MVVVKNPKKKKIGGKVARVSNKGRLTRHSIPLKPNQTVGTGLQNAQSSNNPTSTDQAIEIKDENEEEEAEAEAEAKPQESEWLISIKGKLGVAQNDNAASISAKPCIYRIPQCLRDCDEKAYIPQIVSLGPYHHGNERLRDMDRHKWRALHRVLHRTNQKVELYLDAVKDLEEEARACYEGQICADSNEFVEMMVLDACFILELFRGEADGFTQFGYSPSDPIFAERGTIQTIQRDMIMLENQIPFFILERLYSLQSDGEGVVARLALSFFDPLIPVDEPLTKSDGNKLELIIGNVITFDQLTKQGGLHCLEIFRRGLLAIRTGPDKPTSSHNSPVADKRCQQLIHCVMELRDAGIKFTSTKPDRFWDIKFKNGILEIPRLLIQDGTKSLLLNLIAFEQCHLDSTNDITSYVIFMDNLINSPADVSHLHYCGIIEHWLGSDAEVAELFNRLGREVVFDNKKSRLSELSEQVNKYYDQKWNTWRANLKHRYFNNPWSIISFLAAVMLLVLTFAQTFYSVYGYYMPRS